MRIEDRRALLHPHPSSADNGNINAIDRIRHCSKLYSVLDDDHLTPAIQDGKKI